MSDPSPEYARLLPGDWRHVAEELPPRGVTVEARVSLSETRSIILNLTWLEGDAAAVSWINSITGGPLRDGWRPVEWRYGAHAAPRAAMAPPSSRRA